MGQQHQFNVGDKVSFPGIRAVIVIDEIIDDTAKCTYAIDNEPKEHTFKLSSLEPYQAPKPIKVTF